VLTHEMITGGNAETVMETVLRENIGASLDAVFFTNAAASPGVSPPGILNSAISVTASPSGQNPMAADIGKLAAALAPVSGNGQMVLVAAPSQAAMGRAVLVDPPPILRATHLRTRPSSPSPPRRSRARSARRYFGQHRHDHPHGEPGSRFGRIAFDCRRASAKHLPNRLTRASLHTRAFMGEARRRRRDNHGSEFAVSISEHYKKSVVDEARRTLRRLDAKLAEQPQEAAPSSVVDNNALWREQAAEIERPGARGSPPRSCHRRDRTRATPAQR